MKSSSEDEDERGLQDVFKTSSSTRMFAGIRAGEGAIRAGEGMIRGGQNF